APRDLARLAREVVLVTSVSEASTFAPPPARPGVPSRKNGQVAALVALCRARGFAPRRVVDVGAGAGHLTRALARGLGVEAVALTGRQHDLAIERDVLGLANAFEGPPDLDARAVRFALRRLLRSRGVDLAPGEETRGLNPRQRRKLAVASERAFARLGLALP